MMLLNVPETYFSVSEELRLFALSCVIGAGLGVWYDVFRLLRLLLPHSSLLVAAEDIIFIAGCTGVFCIFTSLCVRGELHWWYLLGSILGAVLYLLTLGSLVMRALRRLILPVKKAFVLIGQATGGIFVRCSKVSVIYFKKLAVLLMKCLFLLYNNKESKIRKNVDNVVRKEEEQGTQKRSV
ncbi:MAG: spore cortex biosynthesis protein YabQ [Ruminococcus sp.]|nr:spore cortex biosynthesis protein YabQ [Ruminococcus sp.]